MANVIDSQNDYLHWRDKKLASAITNIKDCLVEINNPLQLTFAEKSRIKQLTDSNNFALFEIQKPNNPIGTIISLNQQFGLVDHDQHLYAKNHGLSQISVSNNKNQSEFIPYTDKAIGWHTDGYYNAIENRIRAFSLFCVQPAASGGENKWIDQQMVYLLLREQNSEITDALSHPQAMSIPAHVVDGVTRRKKSVGPIFFIDQNSSELYMRYTQRKKHIELYSSTEVKQAVETLDQVLASDSDHHFCHTMKANQGMLCNNVLHKRMKFTDDTKHPRMLLRGRYFNRIS